MNATVKFLLTVALAYGVMMGTVFAFQSRMVFFPTKGAYGITPRDYRLEFEAVKLATADGETIAAWWIPAPASSPARGAVLHFHGNAGNISHRIDYARMFHGMGYHTLLVEYRGYGESSGTPSEEGTYRDAEAAWTWLTVTRGIKASDVVIFGESLGGGVAAWLAARQSSSSTATPRALILASAFTSIPDLGAELYPWLPVRWIARIHYNNLAQFEKIRVPVMIAHSPGDEIIPYAHGRKLFDAAREPKTFLELRGGHNEGFVFVREEWVAQVRAFLDRHEVSAPK